ncbi:MAG: bifunctional enoyl-CoA hydratase/phosphate acetyltransferase [Pseudomonadota bacterium]
MTKSSTNGHSITAQSRPHFAHLLDLCAPLPPLRTAVICPEEETALAGALLAANENLIEPILVGDRIKIQETAAAASVDISAYEIVDAEGKDGAAHAGVDLVIAGCADGLMKGFIHSDTYLSAVIRKKDGLRTAQRTSHCFVMDVPNWPKPVIITDAALNVAPEVKHKISIAQNAVDLARALEIEEPKVAVLSAVESPNPAIASSVEARAVAEAAQDGAVVGGLVDGPFALDNAVSIEAADLKGITSPVAGKADVLLVPSIEAGNILFKALTFMCGSETAGLVVGAKVPVILTSRADSEEARIASCALAVLYDRFLKSAG